MGTALIKSLGQRLIDYSLSLYEPRPFFRETACTCENLSFGGKFVCQRNPTQNVACWLAGGRGITTAVTTVSVPDFVCINKC